MRGGHLWVSPGFLLLSALFLLWDRDGTAAAVMAAGALHEGGHLAALYAAGGRVRRVEFTLLGAKIVTEKGRGWSYGGELLSVLAGPGANLGAAALCAAIGWKEWHFLLGGVNLALGTFNLLPIPGLDGGRAIRLLGLLLK